MYGQGQGVQQDFAQALIWFRKAAGQGDALAQYFLGVLYRDCNGVPQDKPQALAWYRKSADQGNALAQFDIGSM
jgi:TPR repeat protein